MYHAKNLTFLPKKVELEKTRTMPIIQIHFETTFNLDEQRKKTKKTLREKILQISELDLSSTKPELITVHFIKAEPTGEEQVFVFVTMDKRTERTKSVQDDVANIIRTEIKTVQNRLFGESSLVEVFILPFDHSVSGFAG